MAQDRTSFARPTSQIEMANLGWRREGKTELNFDPRDLYLLFHCTSN